MCECAFYFPRKKTSLSRWGLIRMVEQCLAWHMGLLVDHFLFLCTSIYAYLGANQTRTRYMAKTRHLVETTQMNTSIVAVPAEDLLHCLPRTVTFTTMPAYSRPATGATTCIQELSRKFPKHRPTTAIIGKSQTRYLHRHLNPYKKETAAFITILGA